jgi:hypothetical protein
MTVLVVVVDDFILFDCLITACTTYCYFQSDVVLKWGLPYPDLRAAQVQGFKEGGNQEVKDAA